MVLEKNLAILKKSKTVLNSFFAASPSGKKIEGTVIGCSYQTLLIAPMEGHQEALASLELTRPKTL